MAEHTGLVSEADTTRCKKCGVKYDASLKKCPNCGKKNPNPIDKVVINDVNPMMDQKMILKQMMEHQKNTRTVELAPELEGPIIRCKKCDTRFVATLLKCPACGRKNPTPYTPPVKETKHDEFEGYTGGIVVGVDDELSSEAVIQTSEFVVPEFVELSKEDQKALGVEETKSLEAIISQEEKVEVPVPEPVKEEVTPIQPVEEKPAEEKVEETIVEPTKEEVNVSEEQKEASVQSGVSAEEKARFAAREKQLQEMLARKEEALLKKDEMIAKREREFAQFIKEEREKVANAERGLNNKIGELTNQLNETILVGKNKDLYVSRLYNENYSLKNTCERLKEENKRQSDKKVQDFLSAIADILTKTDSGIVKNDNVVTVEKQLEYILSKLKNVLVTQDFEIVCPKIGSKHDRQTANCKHTIKTDDSGLEGKIALVDTVGIRNSKDNMMIVKAIVHVYSNDESIIVDEEEEKKNEKKSFFNRIFKS